MNFRSVILLVFSVSLIAAAGCKDVTSQTELVRRAAVEGASQVAFGDTGKVGNLEMTLIGVRTTNARDDVVKDIDIRIPDPEEGHIYFLVDALIKNNGDSSEIISSRQQINMFDSVDKTQSWGWITISKGTIDGRIGPGAERRGELVWEVKEDAVGLNLVFGGTVFNIGDVSDFRPGPSG